MVQTGGGQVVAAPCEAWCRIADGGSARGSSGDHLRRMSLNAESGLDHENRETAPRTEAGAAGGLRWGLAAVAAAVLLAIAFNWILPLIDWTTVDLRMPELFPPIHPVGRDFQVGVIGPAQAWLAGSDPYQVSGLVYPPATLLIGLAFNLLPRPYLSDILLILFACVAAV